MTESTILLVDDDDDTREIMGLILEGEGYRPVAAANGLEALELLESGELPRFVLLDMMMPVLNGEDFLRRLKSRPSFAEIPVVVMSGDTKARRIAQSLGAVGSVAKPVELDTLIEIVHRYVPTAGG
ncbi:MAG: response regulator [Polyangiales bacterium]